MTVSVSAFEHLLVQRALHRYTDDKDRCAAQGEEQPTYLILVIEDSPQSRLGRLGPCTRDTDLITDRTIVCTFQNTVDNGLWVGDCVLL